MRAGASLGLRIATAVAFGATAALAVTLNRGAPVDAALTSEKGPDAPHAAARRGHPVGRRPVPRCAVSGLRISVGPGSRVTTVVTRYPLDFTNVSGAPCTLTGYPEVTAYQGDGVRGRRRRRHATRPSPPGAVVLAPGQTAHTSLDASLLRPVPPGPRDRAARRPARPVRRPLRQALADGLHRRRAPRAGLPAGPRDPAGHGRQRGRHPQRGPPHRRRHRQPGASPGPRPADRPDGQTWGVPLLTHSRTGKW